MVRLVFLVVFWFSQSFQLFCVCVYVFFCQNSCCGLSTGDDTQCLHLTWDLHTPTHMPPSRNWVIVWWPWTFTWLFQHWLFANCSVRKAVVECSLLLCWVKHRPAVNHNTNRLQLCNCVCLVNHVWLSPKDAACAACMQITEIRP